MEVRYEVVLEGRKIGTIHLDPNHRGAVYARLAPVPAFRRVARLRERAATLHAEDSVEDLPELSRGEEADAEGAGAALNALRFSLCEERTGRPVATSSITLQPGEPPRLQIVW